jgi:hypothetical protein
MPPGKFRRFAGDNCTKFTVGMQLQTRNLSLGRDTLKQTCKVRGGRFSQRGALQTRCFVVRVSYFFACGQQNSFSEGSSSPEPLTQQ